MVPGVYFGICYPSEYPVQVGVGRPKGVLTAKLVLLARSLGQIFCLSFVFRMYVVFCFRVFVVPVQSIVMEKFVSKMTNFVC